MANKKLRAIPKHTLC